MPMIMEHSYQPSLVGLSLIVAIVAAYTALDLAGRVQAASGRARLLWTLGGATAMGAGIWTMHFVGMLAFQLPVPIGYSLDLVVLSIVVAILASAFALWTVARPRVRQWHLAAAALAMGAAIAGMHYVGMAAMRVDAHVHYDRSLWWTSIGIAVGASHVALTVARLLSQSETTRTRRIRAAAAVAMGFAISGMHYSGMAAARFTAAGHAAPGQLTMAPMALAIAVATAGLLIAGLALLASLLDRVLRAHNVEAELRAAKEAAEETSRAKSAFLSNMSHELRTPLNSVIGFANILLKNKAGTQSAQDLQYLDRIARSGEHLLELINSILDLAKIEARRVELETAPVDVAALVRDVVHTLEPQAMAKGLDVVADVPAELGLLHTDQTKLRQILLNLVGNAVKFTRTGSIVVRVTPDGATGAPKSIDVVDTGIGIPEDRVGAIFGAFQQADASTSRLYGGTGLGLTITRSLAQLMGYDIAVASHVGVGSTFSLVLGQPMTVAPTPPAAPPEPLPSVFTRHGNRRLGLVIDDDPDARILMSHLLRELDCDVITATSADEGLALARRAMPDFITIDLMMPGKSGIKALHEFKTDRKLADIDRAVSPQRKTLMVVMDEPGGSGATGESDMKADLSAVIGYLGKRPEPRVASLSRAAAG